MLELAVRVVVAQVKVAELVPLIPGKPLMAAFPFTFCGSEGLNGFLVASAEPGDDLPMEEIPIPLSELRARSLDRLPRLLRHPIVVRLKSINPTRIQFVDHIRNQPRIIKLQWLATHQSIGRIQDGRLRSRFSSRRLRPHSHRPARRRTVEKQLKLAPRGKLRL
jgi:hypothetical protein